MSKDELAGDENIDDSCILMPSQMAIQGDSTKDKDIVASFVQTGINTNSIPTTNLLARMGYADEEEEF